MGLTNIQTTIPWQNGYWLITATCTEIHQKAFYPGTEPLSKGPGTDANMRGRGEESRQCLSTFPCTPTAGAAEEEPLHLSVINEKIKRLN